ncbi:MAG TPA: sigma-70 family RNA polymerase sigma factor [Anaerohalosphaeraceae bacterium]|nr:sigma-70 family RNA polymerase sigma factor [Anaerohalosphaeraceae bacterium]
MSNYNRGQQFSGEINYAIHENLNLIHVVLKKHYSHLKPWQTDEAFVDGILGLWAALKQYESGKQSFKTYAKTQIRYHIQRGFMDRQDPLIRHLECEKYTIQQFIELGFDQGQSHKGFEDIETNDLINLLIGRLTEYEKEIVHKHFWDGWSFSEVARFYGTTKRQIQCLIETVLMKMKQHAERIDAV